MTAKQSGGTAAAKPPSKAKAASAAKSSKKPATPSANSSAPTEANRPVLTIFGLPSDSFPATIYHVNVRKHVPFNRPEEQLCDVSLRLVATRKQLDHSSMQDDIYMPAPPELLPLDDNHETALVAREAGVVSYNQTVRSHNAVIDAGGQFARLLYCRQGITLKQCELEERKEITNPSVVIVMTLKGIEYALCDRLLIGMHSVAFVAKDAGTLEAENIEREEANKAKRANKPAKVKGGKASAKLDLEAEGDS